MYQQLMRACILAGVVCLPIAPLSIVVIPGQLRGLLAETSSIPILLGTTLWLLYILVKKRKIYIPKTNAYILLWILFLEVIVSTIINSQYILSYNINPNSALQRNMNLSIGLIYCFITVLFIFNVFKDYGDEVLNLYRKALAISFGIVVAYSSLEILTLFGVAEFNEVMRWIDESLRAEQSIFMGRIRSVSLEPSMFAMYASVVFPWLATGTLLHGYKLLQRVLMIFLIVLVFFTFSRSMYILIFIESVLLAILNYKQISMRLNNRYTVLYLMGLFTICYMVYDLADTYNFDKVITSIFVLQGESNIARYATQVMALHMFYDNPFFGVGLGQFMYHAIDYIPSWGYESVEISTLALGGLDKIVVHGLYARFIAELGALGLIFWCSAWLTLIREMLIKLRKLEFNNAQRKYVSNFLIAMITYLFSGFMHDSFTSFFLWSFFSIGCIVIGDKE